MKNIRFVLFFKAFVLLTFLSQAGFSQHNEVPKNTDQNRKSQVDLKSSSDIDLENARWLLVEIDDYILPELKRPVYLQFNKKDKLVTASGLCNTINGNYKRENRKSSLVISLKPMTIMACEPENQVEVAISQSLKMVNRYEIADENLYLYRGKALLLTLTARKAK